MLRAALPAIVVAVAAGCVGRVAPAEGSFTALTYNVAGLPQGFNDDQFPEQNIPQISPKLNAYDLVLVQEDFEYTQLLRADLEHSYASDPLEEFTTPVGDGLNIFSDFLFDPVLERVRWVQCFGTIDGASDCLASKGFAATRVALADDVELLVVDLHGEAGEGPDDEVARAAGFAQLTEWMSEHDGEAVLVGGDTNLHGDFPVDAALLQQFLDDTGLADACRTLACGDEQIDRFFFRSGDDLALEVSSWALAGEFVDDGGVALSDHPAVRLDVAWRARPGS
jgi:hypothetical protein